MYILRQRVFFSLFLTALLTVELLFSCPLPPDNKKKAELLKKREALETRLRDAVGGKRIELLEQLAHGYSTGQPQKTVALAREALALLDTFPNPERRLSVLLTLSSGCLECGRFREGLSFARQAYDMAKETGNPLDLAGAYHAMADAHRRLGEYGPAIEFLTRAQLIYQEKKKRLDVALMLNNLGLTYWELGEYPRSLDFYLKALNIREQFGPGDSLAVGILYNNIGRVYWRLKKLDQALEYYRKAAKVFRNFDDHAALGGLLNNIAAVYTHKKEYPRALSYLKESLDVKKRTGNQALIATTLNNIGDLYERTGNLPRALEYYRRTLTLMEKAGNKSKIALCEVNLGSVTGKMKDFDAALGHLNRAVALSEESGAKSVAAYAYLYLSKTHETMGNYAEALKNHRKYKTVTDSLFNEKKSARISEIQEKYKAAKKEKEIALLKKDNQINQLQLARQKSVIQAVIIISLLLVLLAFMFFARYRLKNQANALLQKEMSERKQAEAELVKSRKLESVALLAGGIAHDFNNLLSVIVGNLSMAKDRIRDREKPAKAEPFMINAEKATHQAADLVNAFLTLSEADWMEKQPVDPGLLFRNLAAEPKLKDVRYSLSLPENPIPPAGDEHQLRQVFSNLLLNAHEAVREKGSGGISILWENLSLPEGHHPPLPAGQYAAVTVNDTGKGIPPGLLDNVFDPYFSTKERGSRKGMGLGLSICMAVVKKHGGHISAASTHGEGSSFQVLLPAYGSRDEKNRRGRALHGGESSGVRR